jgi:uncharacterized protein
MAEPTFVEAEIWTVAQTDQGNVVLVRPKDSEVAVPIFIGQLETQSILIGMGGVEVPRPLTHDLVVSLLGSLGVEISRVEIHDLREGTFFARLILRFQERDIVVDSRPSDAIGIAVRALCPVFIAESVVEEAGISVNLVAGMRGTEGESNLFGEPRFERPSEGPPEGGGESRTSGESAAGSPASGSPAGGSPPLPAAASSDKRTERLRAELEKAISEEDYERAATIRDKLKELEE